jgi:hypothetical protein
MNENGERLTPPNDDRTPTQEDAAPQKKAEGWVMPDPVFRQSSVYLPKGFAERFKPSEEAGVESANAESSVGELPAGQPTAAEIAAQPEGADGPVAATPVEVVTETPKKKRGFLRLLLIILGLLLAAGVVVAVAAALVIWYFFQASESQNLN